MQKAEVEGMGRHNIFKREIAQGILTHYIFCNRKQSVVGRFRAKPVKKEDVRPYVLSVRY